MHILLAEISTGSYCFGWVLCRRETHSFKSKARSWSKINRSCWTDNIYRLCCKLHPFPYRSKVNSECVVANSQRQRPLWSILSQILISRIGHSFGVIMRFRVFWLLFQLIDLIQMYSSKMTVPKHNCFTRIFLSSKIKIKYFRYI